MRKEFLEVIRKRIAGIDDRWIADIPCGDASWWGKREFKDNKVVLVDVTPPPPAKKKYSIKSNCDYTLPFRQNTFGLIISIEGVEHMQNPHHLIKEFYSLLAGGGVLVITTPNAGSLSSRFQYMLRGKYAGCTPIVRTPDDFKCIDEYKSFLFGEHVSPLDYAQLSFILTNAGFKTVEGKGIVTKKTHYVLLPFIWLIQLITHLGRKKQLPEQASLRGIMNRTDMLLGKHIIICAKKT